MFSKPFDLQYRDIGSVLLNHFHIVIPLSYPCHYKNLCPHKPPKPVNTFTHLKEQVCWVESEPDWQEQAYWGPMRHFQ